MKTVQNVENEVFFAELGTEVFDLSDRDQRIDYASKKWASKIRGLAIKHQNTVCGFDDLIQEAMLIIIKAADRWDPYRGGWATFVYGCLENGILDVSIRTKFPMTVPSGSIKSAKKKKNVWYGGTTYLRDGDDVEDDRHGDAYERIDILDTIDNFDHHRIGQMYFVEKRTMQEIADLTGMSLSTIHRNIESMRGSIKRKLS